MSYYCPGCFDDYDEEIVEIELFKSKKRTLCRCEACDNVYEEDEVYSKEAIIEALDKIISDLKDEQYDAKEEYLQIVAQSEEEIALIRAQIEELK